MKLLIVFFKPFFLKSGRRGLSKVLLRLPNGELRPHGYQQGEGAAGLQSHQHWGGGPTDGPLLRGGILRLSQPEGRGPQRALHLSHPQGLCRTAIKSYVTVSGAGTKFLITKFLTQKVPNNKIPNHKKFLIVNNRHWGSLQYIFPDKIEKTLYATIYISWQNRENIIFYD